MINLPFQSYEEANAYFGIKIPKHFFANLVSIDTYSQANQLDTLDTLFDVFGILRIEGKDARYQQTPIEFFPFGSTGGDGIHYGFIIHTTDEEDYPSAEICPMDDDGAVVIGNDATGLFQNLLRDEQGIKSHQSLLKELQLVPTLAQEKRHDKEGNTLRIKVKPRNGWKFIGTTDGTGVFAEEKYFDKDHEREYNTINRHKTIAQYETLAAEMSNRGFYASQLFYLKELYWNEWPNYELATKYLDLMLIPYEKLNRPHLYEITKWALDTFDKRFIG